MYVYLCIYIYVSISIYIYIYIHTNLHLQWISPYFPVNFPLKPPFTSRISQPRCSHLCPGALRRGLRLSRKAQGRLVRPPLPPYLEPEVDFQSRMPRFSADSFHTFAICCHGDCKLTLPRQHGLPLKHPRDVSLFEAKLSFAKIRRSWSTQKLKQMHRAWVCPKIGYPWLHWKIIILLKLQWKIIIPCRTRPSWCIRQLEPWRTQ